jgi:hypothetical protein
MGINSFTAIDVFSKNKVRNSYGLVLRKNGNLVEDCDFRNNFIGVYAYYNDNIIRGSFFYQNTRAAILVRGVNNSVYNSSFDDNYRGVQFSFFFGNFIKDCVINNSADFGLGLYGPEHRAFNISVDGADTCVSVLGFVEGDPALLAHSKLQNCDDFDTDIYGVLNFGKMDTRYLNNTFLKDNLNITGTYAGYLRVEWPIMVNVTNRKSWSLDSVKVWFFNVSEDLTHFLTTNDTGLTEWANVTDYYQDINDKYFWNNYTLNLSRAGYHNISLEYNFTEGKIINVTLNATPIIHLISPEDNYETINKTPMFVWNGTDLDKDDIVYELNITSVHEFGGGCGDSRIYTIYYRENVTINDSLDNLTDDDCYYLWKVRGSDDGGELWGDWSFPNRLNIGGYVSIVLTRDLVDFGVMQYDESNDTVDDSPLPFLLENDGNVLVDIEINATDLWDTQPNPTKFFEYRPNYNPLEPGSFLYLVSTPDFGSVPAWDNPTKILEKLNWTDVNDTAEIELNVSVPGLAEGAGSRSSVVVFKAYKS